MGKDEFESEYTIELSDTETNFLVVQLPEIAAMKGDNCDAIYETSESFVGAGKFGDSWYKLDLDALSLTVLIDDKMRGFVKEEATVVFEIKAMYNDAEDTEITSDKFSATLKFEPVEVEEDEEVPEATATAAAAAEATTEEEAVEEAVEEAEEEKEPVKVFVPPAPPVKVDPPKNNEEVDGPITVRASVVSGTGDIKVEFSRPIKIEFSNASLRNMKANDYWSKRRWL